VIADLDSSERLVGVLVQHFASPQQRRAGADVGRLVSSARPIRPTSWDCSGDMLKAVRAASGDAVLSRQPAIVGPESRAGQNRKRGLNENLAREIMDCIRSGRRRLQPGGREPRCAAHHHRLDLRRAARTTGCARSFVFNANATAGRRSGCSARLTRTMASRRAKRRWRTSHAILPPRIHRDQIRPPFHGRRSARRHWWLGCRDLPQHRRDLKALTFVLLDSDEAWQAPLTKLRSPTNFWWRPAGCWDEFPEIPGAISQLNCWASRCGRRPAEWIPDTNAAWAAPEGMSCASMFGRRWLRVSRQYRPPAICSSLVAADAASPETRRTGRARRIAAAGAGAIVDVAEFQRR